MRWRLQVTVELKNLGMNEVTEKATFRMEDTREGVAHNLFYGLRETLERWNFVEYKRKG